MHSFRSFKVLLLVSTFLWACIDAPPAAPGSDMSFPPNNVVTTDMGDDVSIQPDMEESCGDDQKNQDETDVDCGGSCEPCDINGSCKNDGDCANGICEAGVCKASDECTATSDRPLSEVYANPLCSVIALESGEHTLVVPITRNVTLQGLADDVVLTSLTVDAGSVKIKNVSFVQQTQDGGGAVKHVSGALSVENVRFRQCASTLGGAIWSEGNLRVVDSTFDTNTATLGGAIYSTSGSLEIHGSTFTSNRVNASNSAGGAIWLEGTLIVQNSTFEGNEAKAEINAESARGGAIFAPSGLLEISNSTFRGNVASSDSTAFGGAIMMRQGVLTVEGVVFDQNSALAPTAKGGAIFHRDVFSTFRQTAFIRNAVECQSTCIGGAIAKEGEGNTLPFIFENVTFGENLVQGTLSSPGKGAAINVNHCFAQLHSVTFKDNLVTVEPTIETIHFDCSTVHTDNSVYGDSAAPVFGPEEGLTKSNKNYTTLDSSKLDVVSDLLLGDLEAVSGTWIYQPETSSPLRVPSTCWTTENELDLVFDQAGNSRPLGACVAGAFQGSTP